jgi:hypothetical protein
MKGSIPWLLLGLGLAGCVNDSPSAASQAPNVAGTYLGPVTWMIDGAINGLYAMSLTVTQVGEQVTISGSMLIDGQNVSVPAMTGTVNATGFFTLTSGTWSAAYDPLCGNHRVIDGSLTFSDRTALYVKHETTDFCGSWALSGTLAK